MTLQPDLSITLAQLVQLADLLIEHGITDEAANLLAFVMAQTDVDPTTYDHADDLFIQLESEICPRVIWDAREFAKTATLESITAHLREELPQLLP